MEPLPHDFLKAIAREYGLSAAQTAALVKRLGDNDSEVNNAAALYISQNALRSRMTGVYAKFAITYKGPGKLRKLHDFLLFKFQKQQAPLPKTEIERDIDAFVQEIRDKVQADIHTRCGTMRVLDMEQPIGIGDIYTRVNILKKILGHRRLSVNELIQASDIENFDRFSLGEIRQRPVPGLKAVEQYDKLMILGKPGAGKTTFMKQLATLCNQGEFQAERVPVFITLKEFSEAKGQPELATYIAQQWQQCGVQETSSIEFVFTQGRALILLDSLDEVQGKNHQRVFNEIKDFSHKFRNCRVIMTCRLAAREYTFEQFTEIELADFDDEQIAEFAQKWFSTKKEPRKSETFMQRLENIKPIKELATNPLLLTLLCLIFSEAAAFPINRAELYKEGLDLLLKKWDAKRNIERDQIYKKLSLKRKEDLLSQLAFHTLNKGEYFFKKSVIEQQIVDYIRNLPGTKDDDALQLDGADILASIEAQHGLLVERAKGIYSFSHLTFQEYFTAKQITRPSVKLYKDLKILSGYITENRYREIFVLVVEMLPEADVFLKLMKQQTDQLLANERNLQRFLDWVNHKSTSVDVSYKRAAVRAFYFALDLALARVLAVELSLIFDLSRALDLNLDLDLDFDLALALDFDLDLALDFDLALITIAFDLDLDLALARTKDASLKLKLKALKAQLPAIEKINAWKYWWKEEGKTWIENLRSTMIEHRNISHKWQFTDTQKEKLQQYYDANKILIDCLNSDCYVTKVTRQEIEDTLLLPISEINNQQSI